jgi:hypothetical protein
MEECTNKSEQVNVDFFTSVDSNRVLPNWYESHIRYIAKHPQGAKKKIWLVSSNVQDADLSNRK